MQGSEVHVRGSQAHSQGEVHLRDLQVHLQLRSVGQQPSLVIGLVLDRGFSRISIQLRNNCELWFRKKYTKMYNMSDNYTTLTQRAGYLHKHHTRCTFVQFPMILIILCCAILAKLRFDFFA